MSGCSRAGRPLLSFNSHRLDTDLQARTSALPWERPAGPRRRGLPWRPGITEQDVSRSQRDCEEWGWAPCPRQAPVTHPEAGSKTRTRQNQWRREGPPHTGVGTPQHDRVYPVQHARTRPTAAHLVRPQCRANITAAWFPNIPIPQRGGRGTSAVAPAAPGDPPGTVNLLSVATSLPVPATSQGQNRTVRVML